MIFLVRPQVTNSNYLERSGFFLFYVVFPRYLCTLFFFYSRESRWRVQTTSHRHRRFLQASTSKIFLESPTSIFVLSLGRVALEKWEIFEFNFYLQKISSDLKKEVSVMKLWRLISSAFRFLWNSQLSLRRNEAYRPCVSAQLPLNGTLILRLRVYLFKVWNFRMNFRLKIAFFPIPCGSKTPHWRHLMHWKTRYMKWRDGQKAMNLTDLMRYCTKSPAGFIIIYGKGSVSNKFSWSGNVYFDKYCSFDPW